MMWSLLKQLKQQNCSLWLESGELELSYGDTPPSAACIEALKANKNALVELLGQREITSQQAFNQLAEWLRAPLSFAQQRLLFVERLTEGSDAYHMPTLVELDDTVCVVSLEAALNDLVERHAALRTVFRTDGNGEDYQQVLNDLPSIGHTVAESEEAFSQALRQAVMTPFQLDREPPLRLHRYQVGKQHFLLLNWHHIAFDGWSAGVFFNELAVCYTARVQGKALALPELSLSYLDFARWQRDPAGHEVMAADEAFWREELADYQPLLLPLDHQRPATVDYLGRDIEFGLDEALSGQLRALAQQHDTTLYTVLLAGYFIALSQLTGQRDVVIGSPFDNRLSTQLHPLVGFFVNALPIRHQLEADQSVTSLIDSLHQRLLAVKAHQSLPFDQLVSEVDSQRDLSRHPIFQVMFSVQRFGTEGFAAEGLPFQPVSLSRYVPQPTPARFDISLFLDDSQPEIRANLNYAASLFEPETIDTFRQMFLAALSAMADAPQQQVSAIDTLPALLRSEIVNAWNQTDAEYPQALTLPQLFEQQVALRPDAPALACGEQVLSYWQLDQQSARLAIRIREQYQHEHGSPMPAGTLVAINVERSAGWIVAILAVLKAGGAYLPLLPDSPRQRNAFIVQDAKPPLMVVNKAQLDRWHDFASSVSLLAVEDTGPQQDSSPLADGLSQSSDLAYVIYTSGTTGQPKGVMVSHRNAVHLTYAQTEAFDAANCSRSLLFAAGVFDAHVSELFVALANGHLAVLADDRERQDPTLLNDLCKRWSVELATLPPALLATLEPADYPTLKVLVTAGETPSLSALERFSGQCKMINAYGPTEITVCATAHRYLRGDSANQIGKAINNTRLYVLDEMKRPVPPGTVGELFVGGAGVAMGYLNRQALTAERFVSNPFATAADRQRGYDRLYRTGDRVRQQSDGGLVFIGRNDDQVKIRGFRVELGEIETLIAELPEIDLAAVVVDEHQGQPAIAAYAVLGAGLSLTLEQLQQQLSEQLPAYMLPSSLTVMEQLPMTVNGKLDTAALPAPSHSPKQGYLAPENPIQQQLCEIWQQLLGLEQVGINDNFFDVGGNSVLIVQLQQQLVKQLEIKTSVVELFAHPNIASLGEFLSTRQQPADAITVPAGTPPRTVEPSAPIAVIGMAGKFPQAGDIETFWQQVAQGYCAVDTLDDDALLARGADPKWFAMPNYVRSAVTIDEQDMFDAAFFGFNERVAKMTDPQHRWMLECGVNALEHAGYPQEPEGQRVGVFVGKSEHFAWNDRVFAHLNQENVAGGMEAGQAIGKDFLATMLSYKLNLTGPSFNLATACSTSLVAVHEACQQIRAGHCEMAMAGGVSLDCEPSAGYLHQPGFIFSEDGYCRPFDADSSGTVRGYGAGLVVLKRLEQALADGDTVYGVIRGSAINNDGADKVSYSAPSVNGQVAAIRDACEDAGIDSATIGYVECHGTGTPLGDPIEISALSQAYQATKASPEARPFHCALGSVKANIGHLDSAAGIAGLIKTLQALRYGQLPPMANFTAPNPQLELDATPFYVNDRLRPWPDSNTPRRAGISSFGIGGTNAHLILEQPPQQESLQATGAQILPLSAKTPTALVSQRQALQRYLQGNPSASLGDIAYTLQQGRAAHPYREALVAADHAELIAQLEHPFAHRQSVPEQARPVIFLFPGQGSQYAAMGHRLSQQSSLFKTTLQRCLALLRDNHGLDLSPWLEIPAPLSGYAEDTPDYQAWREHAELQLRRTENTQPALFCIEYALAVYWMSLGIRPAAMIGHSLGEYVAACIAGVFTLDSALDLVVSRGRLMQQLEAGGMVAVNGDDALVRELAERFELAVAARNGEQQYVLSGGCLQIEALQDCLAEQGIRHKSLATSHAFHSHMMAPVLDLFREVVERHEKHAPRLLYISNLHGGWITPQEASSTEYWVSHLRQAVQFFDGVNTLIGQFCQGEGAAEPVFVEIGPGRVLSGMAASIHPPLNEYVVQAIPVLRAGVEHEVGTFEAISTCWRLGVELDWAELHRDTARRRIALPGYPFEHQSYWLDKVSPAEDRTVPSSHRKASDDWFYRQNWQLHAAEQHPLESQSTLLLGDDKGLAQQLTDLLQAQQCHVMRAHSGAAFGQLEPLAYTVRPDSGDDFDALFAQLKAAGTMPDTIIHFWQHQSLPDQVDVDRLVESQRLGFDSAIALAQALGRAQAQTKLLFVTCHQQAVLEEELVDPFKATLLGASKIIDVEYDGVVSRSIDFASAPTDGESHKQAAHILAEMRCSAPEPSVAYRYGLRFVPAYGRVELPQPTQEANPLKLGGTYLIAGGLGGMGLAFAQYIADRVPANLVVITRREFPHRTEWSQRLHDGDETARHIEVLQQLEEKGCQLLVASAELDDLDAMAEVISQVHQQFGRVDGWIHAAGVVDEAGVIQRSTPAGLRQGMRAKVRGTLVLDRLLSQDSPDFVLLCSSLSVVTHQIKYGQVAYASANEFVDAYATYKQRTSTTAVTAVDWDDWRDAGMSKRSRDKAGYQLSDEEALLTLTVAEGQEIFARALSCGLERVIISIRDLHSWQRTVAAMPVGGLHLSSDTVAENNPPQSIALMTCDELKSALASLLKRMLGVSEITPDDDFFRLGGDSLLVIQLVNTIREQFDISLGLEEIMARPALADIEALVLDRAGWADDDEYWDEWEVAEGFEQEGII
ncbi:hypothetical protein RJ45_08770 [Photobacterium gaetbulicola]|uniref:Amino acid adenylation domain-containing protein n=1 Tax=Photobacterium gaetbulicola TaxID=1295392 RepID=A0A0B9GZ19_9GAMM|nr:non-ribosomal peptide synthetase/type I polyketide synthase [Photobacterium gaetbulicola]KHT63996.1 hypothetical protein RJ45_08770 [Photobacterium gaetbulicola]